MRVPFKFGLTFLVCLTLLPMNSIAAASGLEAALAADVGLAGGLTVGQPRPLLPRKGFSSGFEFQLRGEKDRKSVV